MKNLFFAIICLISLDAFAQDNSKLILGTWVYADIYEKEKADPETIKMAEAVFSGMEILFTPKTATLSVMGKSDETPWEFSKTNPNIIQITNRQGKPKDLEIISLTETRLIIKMGATGTLILKKKI